MKNKIQLRSYSITTMVTGKFKENCYILQCQFTHDKILIDPGDNSEQIFESLAELEGDLKYIIITHGHQDHVGAAWKMSQHFGLPCMIHTKDYKLLRQAPNYALLFEGRKINVPKVIETFQGDPFFAFGKEQFQLLHTPGHTQGSVAVCFDGFLFTGDTLFYKKIGRTDLPGGDKKALLSTIDRITELFPPETILFPGHGSALNLGEAKAWWRESNHYEH
jgi:hydroxyacylglutathione hydrolase